MRRWSGWLCSSYLSSEYEISTLFCSPFKKEISTCLCSPQFIVDNKTFYNTVTTFYGSPKILHHYYYKLHYSGIVYNIMATDVYMKNYSLVWRSSFKIIVVLMTTTSWKSAKRDTQRVLKVLFQGLADQWCIWHVIASQYFFHKKETIQTFDQYFSKLKLNLLVMYFKCHYDQKYT